MASILIVEDDPKTAAAIADGLRRDGHVTRIAGNGTAGNEILSQSTFDAVILDWMLPGLTGIEVLSRIRGRQDRIPVLLLTARDHIEDRVAGLDVKDISRGILQYESEILNQKQQTVVRWTSRMLVGRRPGA